MYLERYLESSSQVLGKSTEVTIAIDIVFFHSTVVAMPVLSAFRSMFKHYERGDMLSDPSIPALVKQESIIRYQLASRFAVNKDVLDIGCGYGYGSYLMAQQAHKVVGIDEDKEAIDLAKREYRCENLEFYQTDVIDYLSGVQAYDLITMFEVIEHVLKQDQFLLAVRNVLRNGGVLLLSTPNRRYTPFYRYLIPKSLHPLARRIHKLIRKTRLSEFWKGLWSRYGRGMLDQAQVEWIVKAKEKGESNQDITRAQGISVRRVQQLYGEYRRSGNEPAIGKA